MSRLRWMVLCLLLLPASTTAQSDEPFKGLKCAFLAAEFRAYIEGKARVPFGTLLGMTSGGTPWLKADVEKLPKRYLRRVLRAFETTPYPKCK